METICGLTMLTLEGKPLVVDSKSEGQYEFLFYFLDGKKHLL